MNVLVVSGIWPPDVGGPASHAPEVASFLAARGHAVEVVTTAEREPPSTEHPVRWVPRSLPAGVRHVVGAHLVARRAAAANVVYTTGMFGRSAAGSHAAGAPYVVKLTADPAHERARRRGLSAGDVEAFQAEAGGARVRALRAARDWQLGGAARILCPSEFLRSIVLSWGIAPERVEVLPNPAPVVAIDPRTRDETRRRLGLDGPLLVFAGRLTAQKSLELALGALARTSGISLVVAGDGDRRSALERLAGELGLDGRVRFVGPQPRERVLELFAAADAAVLSSSWENFPHAVVEALAVGTPVLATASGGVAEVVEDGVNGLLVPVGDVAALARAFERYFGEEELRGVLEAGAAPSVERLEPGHVYGRLEQVLLAAARTR